MNKYTTKFHGGWL